MGDTEQGFNLIECMIGIVIVAIIVTASAPSMFSFIQNSRASALSSKLVTALQFARSEAVKRAQTISICAAAGANKTTCGGATDWNNGWIVFNDVTASGTIANVSDRLSLSDDLPVHTSIASGAAYMTYDSLGFLVTNGGNFTVTANGCSGQHMSVITLSNTGRVNVGSMACA